MKQGFVLVGVLVRHFIKAMDKYETARETVGVNIKEYFPNLLKEIIDNPCIHHMLLDN